MSLVVAFCLRWLAVELFTLDRRFKTLWMRGFDRILAQCLYQLPFFLTNTWRLREDILYLFLFFCILFFFVFCFFLYFVFWSQLHVFWIQSSDRHLSPPRGQLTLSTTIAAVTSPLAHKKILGIKDQLWKLHISPLFHKKIVGIKDQLWKLHISPFAHKEILGIRDQLWKLHIVDVNSEGESTFLLSAWFPIIKYKYSSEHIEWA